MKDLVKKYFEFISYSISFWIEKMIEKEVFDDEVEEVGEEEEGKIIEIKDEGDEVKEKKMKMIKEVFYEWVIMNK